MPDHLHAPGGAKRRAPPIDLCAVRTTARRREIVKLLAELGPLLLAASKAADRSPCDACEPLAAARDLIAAAVGGCARRN